MPLTSKIPLTDVKKALEDHIKSKGYVPDSYVVSYRFNSSGEVVQVRPTSQGFLARLLSKPLVEVKRQRGLGSDMPDYKTNNTALISEDKLREIVYGS